MIKVIAADMDGTLLGKNHLVSKKTEEAVIKACEKGFRFMVVTGRNFISAAQALDLTKITCDYIVSSGAQIRDNERKIRKTIYFPEEECDKLYDQVRDLPVGIMFCSEMENYMLGTREEVEEGILNYIKYFYSDPSKIDLKNSEVFKMMWEKTRIFSTYEEMIQKGSKITKVFLVSDDLDLLGEIKKDIEQKKILAVSSSLKYNLEVTDISAQKGPILKEYIEALGYKMDEVMVLGDSMNDMSMMEMDFGATVAMANADDEIKKVAKYETKSNDEDGVAYIINKMLKMYDMDEKGGKKCQL